MRTLQTIIFTGLLMLLTACPRPGGCPRCRQGGGPGGPGIAGRPPGGGPGGGGGLTAHGQGGGGRPQAQGAVGGGNQVDFGGNGDLLDNVVQGGGVQQNVNPINVPAAPGGA